MIYLATFISFFVFLLCYLRIADRYDIIDKPNERSSHSVVTIRGGGIIFILAALSMLILNFSAFWLPVVGILIIGTISFIDDIYTLPNRLRIIFHIISVSIMFAYLGVFSLPVWLIPLLYILVIGIINAYNFMDGINGITGFYSLVVLGGLLYVNMEIIPFADKNLLLMPLIACFVFLFFNFRKKAVCFAGDVGSVTIAFWIVLLLFDLILTSGSWNYIFFLAVYGVDTILTIIHRLILRENIFRAHRLHFYQILANERKLPHLVVAISYGLLQAFIIALVISGQIAGYPEWQIGVLILLPLIAVYVLLKEKLMYQVIK